MLSFLNLPKSYLNGPIARAELANLQRHSHRQSRWLRLMQRLSFWFAAFVGLIPFWLVFIDEKRTLILLVFITCAVYTVHVNAVLKTLTLASQAVARESLNEHWDTLVLTGLDARKIVLIKWWAVLRCVWGEFALAGVLKLGLAYGLASYFNYVFIDTCYEHLGGGLCYVTGYPYFPYGPYTSFYWDRSPILVSLVISVVILFGLAEAALLSGLGICMGLLSRQHRIIGIAGAAIVRGTLLLAAVTLWILIADHSRRLFFLRDPYATTRWAMNTIERQEVMGTVQFFVSPLADSGTIIAAELMRPAAPYEHIIRRVVTAAFSITVIGALIFASLRLAEWLAVRQHALRPPIPDAPDLHTAEFAP